MMDGVVPPEEPRFTAEGVRTGFLRLLPLAVMIIPFGIAFGVTSVEVGVPERRRAVDERRDLRRSVAIRST